MKHKLGTLAASTLLFYRLTLVYWFVNPVIVREDLPQGIPDGNLLTDIKSTIGFAVSLNM